MRDEEDEHEDPYEDADEDEGEDEEEYGNYNDDGDDGARVRAQ